MTKRLAGHVLGLGIAGLVIAMVCLYFAFTKDIPFTEGYKVEAVFSDTNQIRDGSPVRIAGVDVGKVASSELGDGDTTVMTLEMKDAGRPLHEDAKLKIRPRLFLEGGFYVELQPGSPSAPEIEDGGRIPLAQTAVPVQFNEILSAFPSTTRSDLAGAIDELSTALDDGGAEGLARSQKPLAPVLRDTAVIGEAARGSEPHDVGDLVRGTARITRALASRDDELARLVTDLNTTSGVLASRSGAVAASLRELDGTLGEAPDALSALDRALPPTRRFIGETRPSLRLLPEVLDDSNRLLVQLNGLASPRELDALLDDLTPTLRDLPELTTRLRTLLPLVTPVADCLRERAIPVLQSEIKDGEHSTGQPVYMELVHSLVGLAGGSGSFDGNGHTARYMGSFGENSLSVSALGGALAGRGASGPVGSRPTPLGPGQIPPLRPDAECRRQPAPDLNARTGGVAAATRRTPAPRTTLTFPRIKQLLRRAAAQSEREAGRR